MEIDKTEIDFRLTAALAEFHLQGATLLEWIAPYAMSMHTGLDADSAFIECDGAQYFLKLHHQELPGAADSHLAATAARAAARVGAAPGFVEHATHSGATLFERAPAGWRTVMRPDFDNPDIKASALRTIKRWHGTDTLPIDRPAWHFIDATLTAIDAILGGASEQAQLVVPEDFELLRRHSADLLKVIALSPAPQVPLHGQILASNMLVGPENQILLVDFDHAANGDPLWDLAALALAFDCPDAEHAELLTQYGIAAEAHTLTRLHACMALLDVGWGLWGRLAHFLSPRSNIEFFKYGETRLVRARGRLAAQSGAQL